MSVMLTPVVLVSLSLPTGESVNPRVAGLIGRSGPQNKQPFMVAFFKATEVHLRSIRSAQGGAKQRNPNRSKGTKNQEALRVANVAGKHTEMCLSLFFGEETMEWDTNHWNSLIGSHWHSNTNIHNIQTNI